jgi:hypothetical protein
MNTPKKRIAPDESRAKAGQAIGQIINDLDAIGKNLMIGTAAYIALLLLIIREVSR